jgi:hypothetical protein
MVFRLLIPLLFYELGGMNAELSEIYSSGQSSPKFELSTSSEGSIFKPEFR